jgi:gluconate 2-dehydrogenase alpha chain
MQRNNFELRTECEVTHINTDSTGKRATGATYVDSAGREWEQPAELVFLCAFQMFNVQLLLLSRIGQPYDVTTGKGVIGRNYSYQVTSNVETFFDNKIFNPFIASGSIGMCIDEFNGDNFDHGPYGFVGGGYMGMVQPNARPIEMTPTPPNTPRWGAAWKKAVKDNYLSSILPATHGSCYSYRDNYLDLDPTYKDRFGRPLMRLTFDYHDNEHKMSLFLTDRLAEIVQRMNPRQMVKHPRTGHYSIVPYQTTHTCGGAIMGTDPTTSALNRYLQSWDVHNLFVMGATAFPQNAGYNPTGTVAALCYWSLDAIHKQYLKNPGPLVHA